MGITWPDDRRPVRELEWGAGCATVHDLEVTPPHRDRGVGRALMLELEDWVRARGLIGLGLRTGLDESYAAARHLYRSLGYAERPGSLHILSSRSLWDPPGEAHIDIFTYWHKAL